MPTPTSMTAIHSTLSEDDTGLPSFGESLDEVWRTASHLITESPLETLAALALASGTLYAYHKAFGDAEFRGGDGFATRRQVRKNFGRRALLNKRRILRPSLADTPTRRLPTTEVGIPLGRDKKTGVEVFSPIENSNGIISPPGGGKTALMCGMILDAPGPVLAASSKLDLYEQTAHLRAEAGRVLVFNPQALGGDVPSTLAWDPVIGCRDPEVALRRTRFLLWGSPATKGLKEDDFWQSASFKVLKSFLWAADMEGLSLLDVAAWSKMPTESPATRIYEKYAHLAPFGWKEDLEQTQASAKAGSTSKTTTLDNVFLTFSMTFLFLSAPPIVDFIRSAHGPAGGFDIDAFLDSRADTIYLLGRDAQGAGSIGPLFSALTGEVYEASMLRASRMPGRRNDPPIQYDLDEVAVICPVPLDNWTADARGHGNVVNWAAQGREQLYKRFGKETGKALMGNCTMLVLGGVTDDEHLESLSKLCGRRKRRDPTHSTSADGRRSTSYTYRDEPTLRPDEIKDLDNGEILIVRGKIKPVITRFTPVWNRKDVKAAERAERREARGDRRTPWRRLTAHRAVTELTDVEPEAWTTPDEPPVNPLPTQAALHSARTTEPDHEPPPTPPEPPVTPEPPAAEAPPTPPRGRNLGAF